MKKFATIQLLRAFACFYVLAGHLIFFWGYLFPTTHLFITLFYHGYSGVDLFFVISGFVIFTSTQNLGEGIKPCLDYLRKRFIRIYPIYWIILSFLLLTIGTEYPLSLKTLLFTFLLIPGHTPVIDVTWSLAFELYFYILYSLVLIKKKLFVIPFIIAVIAILYFIIENYGRIDTTHFPLRPFTGYRVIEFFMGVLAGIFYKKIPVHIAYLLVCGGLALFFASSLSPQPLLNFGLPSMFFVSGFAKIESSKKINIPATFILLGDASYAIYLIHDPFLRDGLLPSLKHSANLTKFNFCLLIALTIALGVLIHLYIEKPLMRYLNKKTSFTNG